MIDLVIPANAGVFVVVVVVVVVTRMEGRRDGQSQRLAEMHLMKIIEPNR